MDKILGGLRKLGCSALLPDLCTAASLRSYPQARVSRNSPNQRVYRLKTYPTFIAAIRGHRMMISAQLTGVSIAAPYSSNPFFPIVSVK